MTQALRAVRKSVYSSGERAREQLLEAAGGVFADRGYDRATSREICEIAGVSTAAVNYHFGGIDALYIETLRRAHQSIVTVEVVRKIVESDLSPKDKLLAYLGPIVRRLANPAERAWHMRLICREMVSPSGLRDAILATEVKPRTDYLRGMIADFMGADPEEPVVGQALLTVLAPILIMATAAVPILQMLARSTEEAAAKAEALSLHYELFVLGGLEVVAQAHQAKAVTAQSVPAQVTDSGKRGRKRDGRYPKTITPE